MTTRRAGTTLDHEAEVAARFDALHLRFKREVRADDYRLRAVARRLGPLKGASVLDLGCGKGRFAARLQEMGARVVGLDRSQAMLAEGRGLDRVLGSAARLPFSDGSFDAVVAIEVFEHLPSNFELAVLAEIRRVLRPGGVVAVVDKNAGCCNARRPWLPGLVVKWVDERRGRWMYPAGGRVRERWLWPGAWCRRLGRVFDDARVEFLLAPDEQGHALFRHVHSARRMTLWTARAPGGGVL
jgi:2-polyprenyl-6-hydroxyphenyl methylase/3-demethylubiquinone-9 3-methyltransferase